MLVSSAVTIIIGSPCVGIEQIILSKFVIVAQICSLIMGIEKSIRRKLVLMLKYVPCIRELKIEPDAVTIIPLSQYREINPPVFSRWVFISGTVSITKFTIVCHVAWSYYKWIIRVMPHGRMCTIILDSFLANLAV